MIPIFIYMEKEKRISIVVGFVYFILFLLTSFSSRNSDRISKRMRSLPTAINVAYLVGMGLIAITGFLIHLNL